MNARHRVFGAAVLAAMTLVACYGTRQEARQLDAVSYLVFTGNAHDCTAILRQDGKAVWPGTEISDEARYTVKPGVYELVVQRAGRMVVRRLIYLEDQQTFEVRIP